MRLLGRDVRPALIPSPSKPFVSSFLCSYLSIVECGLECLGVPSGVPVGVDEELSTLALLEPDLGVIFELRNALTGVSISSFLLGVVLSLTSVRESLLSAGDTVDAGDPASLGKRRPLPAS